MIRSRMSRKRVTSSHPTSKCLAPLEHILQLRKRRKLSSPPVTSSPLWTPENLCRPPAEARRFDIDDSFLGRMNDEQQLACWMAEGGASFFLTGAAGTGKSFVLEALAGRPSILVTASTGVAAEALAKSGQPATTFHRTVQCGLLDKPMCEYEKRARSWSRNDPRVSRWLDISTLIVDEITMLTGPALEKADRVISLVRSRFPDACRTPYSADAPFGGLQLIFTGDFCQLSFSDDGILASHPKWVQWAPYALCLTQIVRQQDFNFLNILHQVRRGTLTPDARALLYTRQTEADLSPDAMRLVAYRKNAELENDRKLEQLDTDSRTYAIVEEKRSRASDSELVLESSEQTGTVTIKRDAYMLVTVNLYPEHGIMNGTRGKVVGFIDVTASEYDTCEPCGAAWSPSGSGVPVIQCDDGRLIQIDRFTRRVPESKTKERHISFIPLICAWALTVHRAQGLTLKSVRIDPLGMHRPAQLYTALSRATSLDAVELVHRIPEFSANKKAVAYMDALEKLIQIQEGVPLVLTQEIAKLVHRP